MEKEKKVSYISATVTEERYNELKNHGKEIKKGTILAYGMLFVLDDEKEEFNPQEDISIKSFDNPLGDVSSFKGPVGAIGPTGPIGDINNLTKALELIKDKETIFKKEIVESLSVADDEAKVIIAALVEQGKLIKPSQNTKPYTVVKED